MDRRLTLIKDMVLPCGTAADIGTDHGFLVCALVAAGTARRGIAADINPMPLEKARVEIASRGLGGQITTLLTDGLKGITLESGDAVVIAGMGGELIARILEDWEQRKTPGIDCYLQPMTKPERLRDYLYKTGYRIVTERCCVAASRPYSVMHVIYTGEQHSIVPIARYLGEIDPRAGASEAAYCQKLHKRLTRIAIGRAGDSAQPQARQLVELIAELSRRMDNVSI